jgi:DNA-binding ferritin-like protein
MKEELIAALKVLLADEYALYFKAHGHHWNVESKMFSQYHEFYAEIADDVMEQLIQLQKTLGNLVHMHHIR